MSFDRNGDLVEEPLKLLGWTTSIVYWDRAVCTICGKELIAVGTGPVGWLRCPLHGSRGVKA